MMSIVADQRGVSERGRNEGIVVFRRQLSQSKFGAQLLSEIIRL
jgi:hypothetical protein